MALAELGRTPAHVVGEEELAARRRPEPVDLVEGALVGDRERPDLVDVVAPELHAQRVLLGRREDVDDAAAHGELATPLDQVDTGVRRVGQSADDVLERSGVARGELHRLEVAEALDLRLQHRAHRGHDDPQRAVGGLAARVAQPPQHGQPPTDRVTARAEAFVGQRLPAGVVAHQVGVEEVAERLDQVLGLAGGRRHRQHGAAGVDQAADHERPQGRRAGQVDRGQGAGARVGDRGGQRGVGEDGVGEAGKAHG